MAEKPGKAAEIEAGLAIQIGLEGTLQVVIGIDSQLAQPQKTPEIGIDIRPQLSAEVGSQFRTVCRPQLAAA